MGKSVPKGIKSKARVLLQEMPEKFNTKFEDNKKNIVELKLPFSKWTTNVMAGFMTRHHKKIIAAEKKKEDAKAGKKEGPAMKEAPDMKKVVRAPRKKVEAAPVEAAEVVEAKVE